jgi:hypothetical protein
MMMSTHLDTLQARCERWEKEVSATNVTADHLEDQVGKIPRESLKRIRQMAP